MIIGVRRVVAAAIALALVAVVAVGGAVEVAKARSTAGTSTVSRDGQSSPVSGTTQFQEGDVLRVPSDADRLTVEFSDGSSMSLVGPATLRFGEMSASGRRVVLASGVITEATARGVALEIQAPQPYDASMVLQNSRGFARINPGDRVKFQKLEGNFAKVWSGGQFIDLGDTAWEMNVRSDAAVANPTPRRPSRAASNSSGQSPFIEVEPLPNDTARMTNGSKSVSFHPASKFTRERTDGNGVRLCYQGGDAEFGVVEIGINTTLFLADGECVEFDANGDVIRFEGIAHVYHPLTDALMFDEPIENAIDASPSYSKKH
jgi:hypothetical protein